jgi:hypothetical protein
MGVSLENLFKKFLDPSLEIKLSYVDINIMSLRNIRTFLQIYRSNTGRFISKNDRTFIFIEMYMLGCTAQ